MNTTTETNQNNNGAANDDPEVIKNHMSATMLPGQAGARRRSTANTTSTSSIVTTSMTESIGGATTRTTTTPSTTSLPTTTTTTSTTTTSPREATTSTTMENSSFYNKIKNCIHVVEPKTIVQSMLGRQPPRQQQQQNVPVTRRRRSTFSWKPSCFDSCPTSSVRRYYVLALFVIQSMLFLWTASSSLLVLLWWYNSNNSSMDYVPRSTPTTTMENNNILPPPATTTTNNNTTSAVASRSSSMSHDHLPFPETTSAAADTTTMSQDDHYHHHYAIPNNLIFTHKYNLLQWTPNAVAMDNNKVPSAADRLEMQALRDNVQHSIALHTPPFYGNTSSSSTVNATWQQQPPPPNVYFWTNDDCRASLQRVLPALVPYFDWEDNRGMIQADMCRGAALYEYGGLYFDVDLGVRRNLWTLLQPTTTFVTVRVHRKSRLVHAGFFQAFCGATPRHPILQLYLLEFLRYYQQLEQQQPKTEQQQHQQQPHGGKKQPKRNRSLPDYRRDPLGVIFLKRAYDQFLAASTTTDRKTSVQHHTTIELWQEVDSAELWQPPSDKRRIVLQQQDPEFTFPDWNPQKRACRMIVLARVAAAPTTTALPQLLLLPPPHSGRADAHGHHPNQTASTAGGAPMLAVPFYSRIANSRMCPTHRAVSE